MKDIDKSKEELVKELEVMRRRLSELEAAGVERHRGEGAFRESDELLRNILAASPVGIGFAQNRRIRWVSETMVRLFGYEEAPKEEYIGKSAEILYPTIEEYERVRKTIYEGFSLGREGATDATFKRRDGSLFDGHIKMSAPDPANPMKGTVVTISEISDWKRAEVALRETEELYGNILESMGDGVLVLDTDFRYKVWNTAMERISKTPREKLIDQDQLPWDIFPHLTEEGVDELMRRAMRGEVVTREDIPYRLETGTHGFTSETFVPLLTDDGKIRGIVGVVHDVTDRKRSEEALRQSEKKYRSLFDESRDGVYMIAREGALIDVNQSFPEIFGYTREEMIGMDILKTYADPADREKFQREIERTGAVKDYELKLKKKDGTVMDCFLTASVRQDEEGRILGYQGILRDVTDQKTAEEALRESELRFQQVAENSLEWIWEVDAEGLYTYASPVVEKILGYKPEEIVGRKHFYDLFHPEDLEENRRGAFEVFAEKGSFKEFVNRNVHKSGITVWLSTSGIPLLDVNGNLLGYRGADTDITARKETEDRLRESEEKYRAVVENIEEGYYEVDLAGNMVFCNDSLSKMLGYTMAELLGMNNRRYMDEATAKEVFRVFNKVYTSGEPSKMSDWKLIRKDGTRISIENSVSLVKDSLGRLCGFRGICTDITERVKAEEALRESEERYRHLFEYSPVSQWEEDFSEVKAHIDELRDSGIDDFREHFNSHPEAVEKCASLVKVLRVNQTTCQMFGAASEDELLRELGQVLCEESYDALKDELVAIAEGRTESETEGVNRTLQGDTIRLLMKWSVVPGFEKTYSRVLVSFVDITDRIQAEEALRESEERYRQMADNPLMGVFIQEYGPFSYVNARMAEMLGYRPEEMIGRHVLDFVHPDDRELVYSKRVKRIYGRDVPTEYEFRALCKDGGFKWFELYAARIHLQGRSVIMGNVMDITDRKKAEEALRDSEEKLRSTFSSMEDFVFLLDKGGFFVGYHQPNGPSSPWYIPPEQFMGKSFKDILPPQATGSLEEAIKAITATDTVQEFDYPLEIAGQKAWFSAKVSIRRDNVGDFAGVTIVARDITERKRTEERINQLNQLKEDLLDPSSLDEKLKRITDGIVEIFDADFCRIWITKSGDRCDSGCIHARVTEGPHVCRRRDRCLHLSTSSGRYTHTDGEIHCRVPFGCYKIGRVAAAEDARFLTNDVTKDPRVHDREWARSLGLVSFAGYRLLSVNAKPIGVLALFTKYAISPEEDALLEGLANSAAQVIQTSIAEEALKESEKQLRLVSDSLIVLIAYVDSEQRYVFTNRAYEDWFGTSSSDLVGRHIKEVLGDEFYQGVQQNIASALSGNRVSFEATMVNKKGEFRNVIATYVPDMVEADRINGFFAQIVDVTEHKRAEKERIRLATAIEQAAEIVFITDTDGTIQYANPAFEQVTGYTREEAIGQNARILQSGEHDEAFYEEMWDTLTSGKVWTGHLLNKKKDGTVYEEEATLSPIKDEAGTIVNYVAVKRDVTKEMMLEKQLRHAQKMEAVGTLAGGFAHDFNNLLQIIAGYTDLLMMEKSSDSPDFKRLQAIRKATGGGADLVGRILTFSSKVETNARPIDLNHEVRQAKELLLRTIPKMIEIQLALDDEVKTISADPGQIEQVIFNLAVNAKDAMPEGGRLVFETENVVLDEQYCGTHLEAKPGEYVLLTVSDTGHGMQKELMERIFEPFFTTKDVGEGTGLGLSMVFGIVRKHGGHITCYSEPSVGTTFRTYLPVIETETQLDAEATIEIPAGGTETLLLVDDEEQIRILGTELLRQAGYRVLTASTGQEALEIYRKQAGAISLVILDLVMPEMSGNRCLEELLRIDPQAKVLIASGYSANGPTDEVLRSGARAFVGKPFDMRRLLHAVREILDES